MKYTEPQIVFLYTRGNNACMKCHFHFQKWKWNNLIKWKNNLTTASTTVEEFYSSTVDVVPGFSRLIHSELNVHWKQVYRKHAEPAEISHGLISKHFITILKFNKVMLLITFVNIKLKLKEDIVKAQCFIS